MSLVGRRVLVVQHRLPEFDRERGSLRVLHLLQDLTGADAEVSFLALRGEADDTYARHLRRAGIVTLIGSDTRTEASLVKSCPEVVVVVFWHTLRDVAPLLARVAPDAPVVVDSVDLHFLREARRRMLVGAPLDGAFGEAIAGELNAYSSADTVLAVSKKEARLIDDLLAAPGRAVVLPLAEDADDRPTAAFGDRRGVVFVGNFRHLPNAEAVRFLLEDVLPRLRPELLDEHPVRIVGHALPDAVRAAAAQLPNVQCVGWVPDVVPYFRQSRLAVVPLLHGAGVKGKLLQAAMLGTPTVSTSVGVEGALLRHGDSVVIADDAVAFAEAITLLLTDEAEWFRISRSAARQVADAHGRIVVAARTVEILEAVLASGRRPQRSLAQRDEAYLRSLDELLAKRLADGDRLALLVTADDPARSLAEDAGLALLEPGEGKVTEAMLSGLRLTGTSHLLVPARSLRILHTDRSLHGRLSGLLVSNSPEGAVYRWPEPEDERPRLAVFGGGPDLDAGGWRLVHVHGAASPDAMAECGAEVALVFDQPVTVPVGFVDDLLEFLLDLDLDVAEPAISGGQAIAPLALRQGGVVARLVERSGLAPVRAIRRGVLADDGSVADRAAVGVIDDVPLPRLDGTTFSLQAGIAQQVVRGAAVGRQDSLAAKTPPPRALSVVIATRDRAELLRGCLASLMDQDAVPESWEVVVVDDGSVDSTPQVITDAVTNLPLRSLRTAGAGRSAAKNLGITAASGAVVLLLDDDDVAEPGLVAAHLAAHEEHPDRGVAILGYTGWAEGLTITPFMRFVTEVDHFLFAYPKLQSGSSYSWQHFWEGRLSVKREFLLAHGLHDERLAYTVDIELGWRLAPHGLSVVYDDRCRSAMARPVDLASFLHRAEAKGFAQWQVASLHDDPQLREYCGIDKHLERWRREASDHDATVADALRLEERCRDGSSAVDEGELFAAYRHALLGAVAKGVAQAEDSQGELATHVALSIVVPVWSVTEELAAMARQNLERIRAVASVPTEIIVVDNGSPVEHDLPADLVHRFPNNRGVAPAWNKGARMARGGVVAFLNSDVWVHPGWDSALIEAAGDGRRIAFPFTDHGDDLGVRRPDQAGTAGWCFALTPDLLDRLGPFDESFSPAFYEDTDYWHRAWKAGVYLTPVPDAAVTHSRRTTAKHHPAMQLMFDAHRLKYAAKHGVDPSAPPPFHRRVVSDYVPRRRRPVPQPGPAKIFGVGLNKTATSSLHAALEVLGLRSLHWGGVDAWRGVARAADEELRLLHYVGEDYDAYSDIGTLIERFALADRQYPGSRFILTTRERDDWLASRRRHVERNTERKAAGAYDGYNLHVDLAAWTEEWDAHHDAVLAHFADRPEDLLVIDICAGEGWERLAPFLGFTAPTAPFPWDNRYQSLESEPSQPTTDPPVVR